MLCTRAIAIYEGCVFQDAHATGKSTIWIVCLEPPLVAWPRCYQCVRKLRRAAVNCTHVVLVACFEELCVRVFSQDIYKILARGAKMSLQSVQVLPGKYAFCTQ